MFTAPIFTVIFDCAGIEQTMAAQDSSDTQQTTNLLHLSDSRSAEADGYLHLSLHAEERLRLIEENVRDYALFVVAPDGHIASWNVGAQRILGYDEAEAIGMDCVHLFIPEDIARGAVEHERETARGIGHSEDERWHLRKDGSRFWGSGIMTGLRDQEGNFRGFVKILRDMTERKIAEQQQQENIQQLAEQERQAGVMDERNRIAREIHDTLAQGLTGIAIQMEAAEDALHTSPEQVRHHIARAKQLARESLAEARRSVRALRPQALDTHDLPTALEQCAHQIMEGTTLQAEFAVEGVPCPLLPEDETDLLRIGQEALTNSLKHAQAEHVTLWLAFTPTQVELTIYDDGRGFDLRQVNLHGFGLSGIRERARRMGGEVEIQTAPGQGTRLRVMLPLADSRHSRHSVKALQNSVEPDERSLEQL